MNKEYFLLQEQQRWDRHLFRMKEHLFAATLGGSEKFIIDHINSDIRRTENKLMKIANLIEEIENENTI